MPFIHSAGHRLPDVHRVDRRGESRGVQRVPRQPTAVQARPGVQLGRGRPRVVGDLAGVSRRSAPALRQPNDIVVAKQPLIVFYSHRPPPLNTYSYNTVSCLPSTKWFLTPTAIKDAETDRYFQQIRDSGAFMEGTIWCSSHRFLSARCMITRKAAAANWRIVHGQVTDRPRTSCRRRRIRAREEETFLRFSNLILCAISLHGVAGIFILHLQCVFQCKTLRFNLYLAVWGLQLMMSTKILLHLEVIYFTKFTQPPLQGPLFHDPLSPLMQTSYLEAPILLLRDLGRSPAIPRKVNFLSHTLNYIWFLLLNSVDCRDLGPKLLFTKVWTWIMKAVSCPILKKTARQSALSSADSSAIPACDGRASAAALAWLASPGTHTGTQTVTERRGDH